MWKPIQRTVIFTIFDPMQVDNRDGFKVFIEDGLDISTQQDQMADIQANGQIQICNNTL